MRRLFLAVAFSAALCAAAQAQSLVSNPLILPSATFTTGDCVEATGPTSIATVAGPCGTGTGTGNVNGPTSSTIGNVVTWLNGTGTQVGDSGILAANLPQLGASQAWGGLNSYVVIPTFPTATAGTSTTAGATTQFVGQALITALAPYETSAHAAATYVPLAGGVSTGVQTAPGYTLNAPAGIWKPISFNAAGKQRWQLGANSTGEGGNNTGADFDLFSYADSGAVLQNVLHIPRSTGIAAFVARPTFAGNLAWDAGNLDPSTFATPASIAAALVPYLKSADAASIYLTQVNAAATYTTPAEVNAALASFLTQANAATTYCALAGCTLASLNVTGAATGITPTAGNNSTNFATTAFVNTALVPYLTNATAAATYATIAGVQSAYLRISDAASTYLTIANAASTYFAKSGGTITGATQFNQIPVLNASLPPLTDSSGDVTSSAWVQALITNRVGTGPFIPLTGVGMFYDIPFPWVGLNVPTTPMPSAYDVLNYTFARKVVLPIGFSGAQITCINNATNATTLNIQRTGSVNAIIGTILFTPGSNKGVQTINSSTTTTFMPGDHLIIITNESAGNPAIADPTLNGISGTLVGTISP